ncbi:amidase signature enzyme [Basidiobolus meristosporus CBS 931.73]|uniref:Amidase signature enzyme n=1 Tax=Basidiobolus meristosporus CBS 931.73 TaxID=1314790 RepID=A0A1Y1WR75_9FUNG|nr:amidase signature enzyme [Basidiobolus meristosporus CBS 931.73]|eukprot:ORX75788.1 amidase signature enzyme [Basidiobolus meristosporus CBS 931.73]
MPKCGGVKLEEASIDQIQTYLKQGRLTSRQIVQCYLARIKQINPHIRAVIETNPDVLQIADDLDCERKEKGPRGPLHGIPIIVKDNIATDDKMSTGAGSLSLVGSKVPRDAHVVMLLRKAGAIILGKANMSEFADMRASSYSEGWSGRGGQCRSPYNLTQNAGGSSSGSGAAVGANLVTVALGTDTDGSVTSPGNRNMLAGIRPTRGLTSRNGVIPLSSSLDTVGVLAKSVKDAAYVLNVISGVDKRDPVTTNQRKEDYTKYLTKNALQGVRIGIPHKILWQAETTVPMMPTFKKTIGVLRSLGATIVNNTNLPKIDELATTYWSWMPNEFLVSKIDFKEDLNKYLSELVESPVRSLQDIIDYNEAHKDTEMQFFGQDILIESQQTNGKNKAYYKALATNQRNSRQLGIDFALKKWKLDALLLPGDQASAASQPHSVAGYPAITTPVGLDSNGVPYGIMFVGTAWTEAKLMGYAYALESALRIRQTPRFYEIDRTNDTYPIPI